MENLIKALQLLSTYMTEDEKCSPTGCVHDELHVRCNPKAVTKEDLELLEQYGFYADEVEGYFVSYKYGSC